MRRAFSASVFAISPDNRILLINHKLLKAWLPVGGELEHHKNGELETPLEAARRELYEETGLQGVFPKISEIRNEPLGLISYEEHEAGSKGFHMNFCFMAFVGSTKVIGDDSFSEHKWFSPSEALALSTPENVHQLLEKLSAIIYYIKPDKKQLSDKGTRF